MSADKIIVALDYDDPARALSLVNQIKGYITFFKVGSQLFTRSGPEFVRQLRSLGVEVFLDLKYHDIPATVGHAVREAAKLDVRFLTIHASGGSDMIKAAVDASAGTATTVLAVTVLTSMNEASLKELNIQCPITEQVLSLAQLAQKQGLRGLVCSPWELTMLRQELSSGMILVTPGIRASNEASQDQVRTLSAPEAIKLGASYLVVGRPITLARDPVAAAQNLVSSL